MPSYHEEYCGDVIRNFCPLMMIDPLMTPARADDVSVKLASMDLAVRRLAEARLSMSVADSPAETEEANPSMSDTMSVVIDFIV